MTDYLQSANSKKAKKKKDLQDLPDTESSDEELDLTKECHPIAHYIDDRAEMISQMFSVIKGNKLKAMLPPLLKDYDVEKLKLKCLDQLLGMSEKRITCLLEGELLDSSSESDASGSDSKESESDKSVSPKSRSQASSIRRKHKRKSDNESVEKASKVSKLDSDQPGPEQGKTLLEILELEMRARAIRALLKQGSENDRPTALEEPPNPSGDVVDLTIDEDEFPTVVKTEPQTEQELNFEDKVVKSKITDKSKQVETGDKKQKLIAELELRNKLIKKKSYRTREQRLENMDVDNTPKPSEKEQKAEQVLDVVVKEEPSDIIEIDEPEEGEVSSDGGSPISPLGVKEEKLSSPEPEFEVKKSIDGEKITGMDGGEFISDVNVEEETLDDIERDTEFPIIIAEEDTEEMPTEVEFATCSINTVVSEVSAKQIGPEVSQNESTEKDKVSQNESTKKDEVNQNESTKKDEEEEETTWRERWLKKDEVQKVVKSSKICGLVKKRLMKKKTAAIIVEKEPSPTPETEKSNLNQIEMLGSVSEYEELLGKDVRSECLDGTASDPPAPLED